MRTSVPPRERALTDILQMTHCVLQSADLSRSRQIALEHLRRLFDATGAIFIAPGRPVPLGPGDAFADGRIRDLPELYRHYIHEDPGLPMLQRARLQRQPLVLTSDLLFRTGRLLDTRFYSEVMRPREMHHAMALLLDCEGTPQGVIAIYRGHGQASFDGEDVATAMTALPVLSSALASLARAHRRSDETPQSIAVLDEDLAVLYRDAPGPASISDWLKGRWHERAGLRAFARYCRAVLAGDLPGSETVVEFRTATRTPVRIAIELQRLERSGCTRLVLLMRPAGTLQHEAGVGATLSPREHQVAEMLVAGASYADVASGLDLSVHTVAHHATAVYRKSLVAGRLELAAKAAPGAAGSGCLVTLTRRERQIVDQLRAGAGNKEIAARLGLSASTVGNHLQKIYRKTGVHGRVELLRRLAS